MNCETRPSPVVPSLPLRHFEPMRRKAHGFGVGNRRDNEPPIYPAPRYCLRQSEVRKQTRSRSERYGFESLPLRQLNEINNLSRQFSGIQGDFSGGINRNRQAQGVACIAPRAERNRRASLCRLACPVECRAREGAGRVRTRQQRALLIARRPELRPTVRKISLV